MKPSCRCRRETAPIPGTMESAVRYVLDPECPVDHQVDHWHLDWRDRRGRRVDIS